MQMLAEFQDRHLALIAERDGLFADREVLRSRHRSERSPGNGFAPQSEGTPITLRRRAAAGAVVGATEVPVPSGMLDERTLAGWLSAPGYG